jgi:aspartate kinase
MSDFKVLKFGGTSVGKPERMHHIAKLLQGESRRQVVVLSAVSGTTNALVAIGELNEKGDKEAARSKVAELKNSYYEFVDQLYSTEAYKKKGLEVIEKFFGEIEKLVSQPFFQQIAKILVVQGELISTNLFKLYLDESGEDAILLPAVDFMTIDEYGEPDMDVIMRKLEDSLSKHKGHNLFITQGFICRNASGGIDNLKRGGSDYSATLIGAALGAAEVQIWTDIDGMHNNDPRVVDKTRPISNLSFEEAGELAYFGAKILHPNCIRPAQQYDIPVRIKNTMDPDAHGTLITSEQNSKAVKAIAAKDGITAIKIKSSRMIMAYGFLRRVFEVFEKYRTPIDMITTSEIAVSLTVDDDSHVNEIIEEIGTYGKVEIDRDQTIICIVGDMVAQHKGTGRDIFKALDNIPIRMISYGGSRNNISILVASEYKAEALQALNDKLFSF